MLTQLLLELKTSKHITTTAFEYLHSAEKPKSRNWYCLPKIHKNPATWLDPYITPKGRPITSDCGSVSNAITKWIDFYLQPIRTLHPSFIRDSYDMIEKLKQLNISKTTSLITS